MSVISDISRSAREFLVGNAENTAEKAVQKFFDTQVLEGSTSDAEGLLTSAAIHRLTGFGALQPYLDREDIEEIWINRPDEIFIATGKGTERVVSELSQSELRTIVLRMLRESGRRVDASSPFTDASLPDGSRLHVVIPEITAEHWSINIRKFPRRTFSLDDLAASKTLSRKQAMFLKSAMKSGKNILISGATHSGKTTLLCALLGELEPLTRLITCEETFEIRSDLQDRVAMQTRVSSIEGIGEIRLRRLVKEALRMRPGYLALGEVREAEALDMLIGMNSGIPGACTIHANSAQAAITKLCTLPLLAGPNISADFVRQTTLQSIDLIVHCRFDQKTGRSVEEICRLELDAAGELVAVAVEI
jgi:pilus assembly protein CpaF